MICTGTAWYSDGEYSDSSGAGSAASPDCSPGGASPKSRPSADDSLSEDSSWVPQIRWVVGAPRTPLSSKAAAFVPLGTAAVSLAEKACFRIHGDSYATPAQEPHEPRTSLILRNVPVSYTRHMLTDLMDSKGFAGQYNFVYVPTRIHDALGLGYAFVNFVSHTQAGRFAECIDGFDEWESFSGKPCEARWSRIQGLAAYIRHFQNSPLMVNTMSALYKPTLFREGVPIPFPNPTQKPKRMKMRASLHGAASDDCCAPQSEAP